jgi:lactate dehydrogenase-like 2-hydroxyacid dehydrogenase
LLRPVYGGAETRNMINAAVLKALGLHGTLINVPTRTQMTTS